MNRRRFLAKAVAMTGALALSEKLAHGQNPVSHGPAYMCSGCANVLHKDQYCVHCGAHITYPKNAEYARICGACMLTHNTCVFCHNPLGDSKAIARLCTKCESHKYKCLVCGCTASDNVP